MWDHTFNHIIPRNALKMYLIFNNWADLPYMFPLLWLLTGEKPSIWVSWLKFSHLHFKVWDNSIVRMAVGKEDDFKQLEFSLDTSTLLGCGSTGRQLESCRWGWSHLKLWGDLFPQTCLESVVCCVVHLYWLIITHCEIFRNLVSSLLNLKLNTDFQLYKLH